MTINRNKIVLWLFGIIWTILFARLYYLSIKSNYYYEELAKANTEKAYYIKPTRGEIIDSRGRLLAMNQIGFSVSIAPHLDIEGKEFKSTVNQLVKTFPDLNSSMILKVYKKEDSNYNHNFIKVVNFIQYDKMISAYPRLSLNENILIETENKRYYPYSFYASHVVGYTGKTNEKENKKDQIVQIIGKAGKSGIEKYYNTFLQGMPGSIISKVTATNEEVEILRKIAPKENQNITLNLDVELQKMIYERFGTNAGAAIVMRPTGEILAAVSTPSYDPNLFVSGINKENWSVLQNNFDHPFTNKFLYGTYPPGSTIKMGMALALNEVNPGTLDVPEYCPGAISVGRSGQIFRDWKKDGHGMVDLRKAIRESVDVYFYKKSLAAGIDNIAPALKKMGLGVSSGVDMRGESVGIIPDSQWKKKRFNQPWYPGETVNNSIGQGYMLVTPLQLARYTALIATSNLPTPLFVSKLGNKTISSQQRYVQYSPKYLSQIRAGMYDVCNSPGGTAVAVFGRSVPVIVAGKTGTSQVVGISRNEKVRMKEEQMEYYHRSHAWITTYAPFNNPEVVVTVLVEHGGHGGSAAGPIAADIYRWLYANRYFKNPTSLGIIPSLKKVDDKNLTNKTIGPEAD
ncbi:MAG: penicillin-binding protein 2 [Sulfurovaceae bacterium]|nr:penicillin-binding protein 2 [Sulfurovaceae bacterium]